MIHLLRAIHEAPCNHTRQPVRLDNDNNPPCFSAPSRLSLLYSAPSVASIDGWVLFSHFSPAPWLKERLAACENVWCEAAEFVSDYMHTEKGKHKRRTTSLARKRVTTSCRNCSNSASESLIISLLPFSCPRLLRALQIMLHVHNHCSYMYGFQHPGFREYSGTIVLWSTR